MEKAYTDRELFDLAELYKIFGDPTRIRILCAMLETELCVNEPILCEPPAKDIKNVKAGEKQARGKVHFLFSGRRTCTRHSQYGHGTH